MDTHKRPGRPSDIISYAVWLCYRFSPSHCDIEDILAQTGITARRQEIRLWCIKFGAIDTPSLKRRYERYGDIFSIDQVFVEINDKQHYSWRAAGQEGEVVDVTFELGVLKML